MKEFVLHLSTKPIPACFLTCGLGPNGPVELAAISTGFDFPPGTPIFLSNCTADAIWSVTEGSVIAVHGGGTHEIRPGEGIYGFTEAFAGISYRHSLYAGTSCHCTRVLRDDLFRLLSKHDRACLSLLERLAGDYLTMVAELAS